MRMRCWFEMKDTRGKKAFPLREYKQEQETFAEAIRYSKKGVLVRTEGITGLPDYKYAYQEEVFVVIKYPEGIAIITAENLSFQKTKRKSLTWEQAQEIAYKVIK